MQESWRFDPAPFRSVSLFRACNDEEMTRVAAVVCRVRLPAGSLLSSPAKPNAALVFVIEGHVEVVREGRVIDRLGPGDHLGARSLLRTEPHPLTVVALDDVVLDRLAADDFRQLLTDEPALVWPLLHSLAGHIDDRLPLEVPR